MDEKRRGKRVNRSSRNHILRTRVNDDELRMVKELSADTETPVSDVLRQAMRNYYLLKKYKY